MCGIAGMWLFHQEADRTRLEQAAALLQHRGPDGQGFFIHKHVGLVHTRLSIVDLDGGSQPLHSYDQNLHLVANGEIYNDPQLRRSYPDQAKYASTQSDCESILHAYQRAGAEGFQQLNGMFAFALYDELQQCLLLARDRLGIKPLFYTQTTEGVFFASEIKSLLKLLSEQPEIHAGALAGFLDYQFNSGSDTIFTGIKRVLPGEYLKIGKNGLILQERYWDLTQVQPQQLTLGQALEAFEPLFREVMTEYLRSDVPLGLFLSGGIDSSILLAELSQVYEQPLRTYSVGFAGKKGELPQAEALAQRFNTEHISLQVNRDQLFKRIVHSIWLTDDLMRDYACLPLSFLAETAADDLKVVFSGDGGDESFAGYRRYAPSLESWLKAWLSGSGGIRAHGQWSAKRYTHAALGLALRNTNSRGVFKRTWRQTPDNWSRMQRFQAVDVLTALPDQMLVKSDRILMGFGLEGRVPFSDHRLVEFGLSLPDAVKYQQRRGKYLLRQWARKYLPAEHLNLPKRGFHVPVPAWLSGSFLDQLEQRLLRNTAIQEWFDIAQCQHLFALQRAGKSYSRAVWGLMQFAIWHRLFVEGVQQTPSIEEDPLDWL